MSRYHKLYKFELDLEMAARGGNTLFLEHELDLETTALLGRGLLRPATIAGAESD